MASGCTSATVSHTSAYSSRHAFQFVIARSLRSVPRRPLRRTHQPTLPGVDIGLPGDDDPRRADVREWLAAHPKPTGRQLAEAGYVVPHWPAPFGRDADPLTQLVIDEELRAAGVRRPVNPIGIGWAGPTLLYAGTAEQKERWLWPLLAGEEFWCQLFSEPGAGLGPGGVVAAGRARRRRTTSLNGQKVWTSYAHIARWGILLARTDPAAAKHAGISYFVCPMRSPGIEVRAARRYDGRARLQRGFLHRRPHPGGPPRRGGERWLGTGQGHPRQRACVAVGGGRAVGDGADGGRSGGAGAGRRGAGAAWRAQRMPEQRAPWSIPCCVTGWSPCGWRARSCSVLRLRTVSAVLAGRAPGAEASVRKAIADAHGQHVMGLGRDTAGAYAMLQGTGPRGSGVPGRRGRPGSGGGGRAAGSTWSHGFLFSPALTVGGGTAEVQRNIVAEKVLGLPRDL